MLGLRRAGILSVWLPNSSQCSMNTERMAMHLSPLIRNLPLPAPHGCARASSQILSPPLERDGDPALLRGGRPGLRREELITRPTLDPLVPEDPRGGAWSGRGAKRRHPRPRTPQAKGGLPRRKTATTHRRIYTCASENKTRNDKEAFSTYLPKASPPFF